MIEPLISIREVAELLGVSDHTVRTRLIHEGLPCLKIGSRLRFRPSAVEQWLAENERAMQNRLAAFDASQVIELVKERGNS